MRLVLILLVALFVVIIGGIGFIASSEVDVEQETVTQTISNERFYDES